MSQLKDLVDKQLKLERLNKRICNMNNIASFDSPNMTRLKEYAKDHPVIFADVLEAFKKSPDGRFGDTLLAFCDGVTHRQIPI